ncbi:MAG: GNAT family N-acetyltransferase [Bacteroidales bacterium]|nr:GNAT family N-acetyltransferase [Bacteroidales bacterium]
MEIKYRLGSNSDKDKLQKLGLISYGQFKKVLTEENWNKFNSFLTGQNTYIDLLKISNCFVCETKEEIIGMAYLIPKGHPTDIFQTEWSYIRMVGVNPNFGGNGIGKKLTQMCIDYAKDTKEEIIALHTSEFMDIASHIYESRGFKQIKELEPRFGKKYWLYLLDLRR